MNDTASIFETQRAKLTAICYRMLGERAGAEDAVQDTWLRWSTTNQAKISNPAAWLTRVATNIAIDALRSARSRREVYVGPWLPEPLVEREGESVEEAFELAQECGLALLWAMERLGETERAAFILREAFDTGYEELATALGKSEAACRQLVSRAHKRLQESGPKFDASQQEVEELLQRFLSASMANDQQEILDLLSPDAIAYSDGGGKVPAVRRPLVGPPEIAQVVLALVKRAATEANANIEIAIANQKPAIVRSIDGVVDSITALAPNTDGKIAWLYVMRNPDKLESIQVQGNDR